MFIEKQKSAAVVWILNLAFHQHMPTTSAYTHNTCIVDMQAHIVFVSPVCNGLVNCLLCHEKEQGEEGIVVGLLCVKPDQLIAPPKPIKLIAPSLPN